MSSIGRMYARQMRREAIDEQKKREWQDGEWFISVRPRSHNGWRMWVATADGPHCRYPRFTREEWVSAAFNDRDMEDWGPLPGSPPRQTQMARVKHTRHTYTHNEMAVNFTCPVELAIWLDQQVAGVPGGRKSILVPLLYAEKRRREEENRVKRDETDAIESMRE